MTYKTLRRLLNWSIGFSLLMVFISFVLTLGAASVSNYFESTLGEVLEIEEKSLLNAPPENVSEGAKDAISFLGNSENIKNYIISADKSHNHLALGFVGSLFLFLVSLTLRIWFRKSKFANEAKVIFSFKHNI